MAGVADIHVLIFMLSQQIPKKLCKFKWEKVACISDRLQGLMKKQVENVLEKVFCTRF